MIIAVKSLKGGTGKTTAVMYIAQALTAFGTVEVHDMDPQASATNWDLIAEDNGQSLDFDVVPSNTVSVGRLRKAPRTDHVVIDTPPGHPDIIKAATRAADVVIVTTEASPPDMVQVWGALEEIQDKPHAVLITKAFPRTITYKKAVAVLEEAEAPLFKTDIRHRQRIKATYGTSLSGQPLEGHDAVLEELFAALGVDPTHIERA